MIIRVGIITEEEEEILKLGPKFTLSRVVDRENFLVKVEKTLAKEKWQAEKSTLVDYKEDNYINFARARTTGIKNNTRLHLPKPLHPTQEAIMELRPSWN